MMGGGEGYRVYKLKVLLEKLTGTLPTAGFYLLSEVKR